MLRIRYSKARFVGYGLRVLYPRNHQSSHSELKDERLLCAQSGPPNNEDERQPLTETDPQDLFLNYYFHGISDINTDQSTALLRIVLPCL